MKVNRNKQVGNVLFIVEGAKTEFAILKHIFKHILNYSLITNKRHHDEFEQYRSCINHNSTIAVINTKESNIKFAGESGDDYIDGLLEHLINEYDFDVDNAWIFYLFDRDHRSNKDPEFIKSLIKLLKNPFENDFHKAGELLLSYPGIESYTLSCGKENIHLINDQLENKIVFCNQLKTYVYEQGLSNIQVFKEEHIIQACGEFLEYLRYTNNSMKTENDLDDFSEKSLKIFEIQENNLKKKGYYDFFSSLSLAFLQLGLIEV